MVSKCQTQAVELKNAIKNITQNVSHFRGGEGGPRESETCLTFGQIFFSRRPLRGCPKKNLAKSQKRLTSKLTGEAEEEEVNKKCLKVRQKLGTREIFLKI